MDHLENEVFTKLLQKYVEVLQDNSLQPAERAKFERMRDDLSDALLQNWLPMTRRAEQSLRQLQQRSPAELNGLAILSARLSSDRTTSSRISHTSC